MADQLAYKGSRWSVVQRDEPSRAGGARKRDVLVHPGSVVLLPFLDDGRVVLIRNERVSVGRALIELCAGTLSPSESPLACARRELVEETGYEAREVTALTSYFVAPGFTDERMYAFTARGLVSVGQRLEDDERIEPFACTVDECLAMVRDGRIEDGKSIAVLLYWRAFGR